MFDLRTALLILAVSLPGIALMVPSSLRELGGSLAKRLPEGKTLPPKPVLIAAQLVQSVLLVGGLTAVGTALAHRVGLGAPVFRAIAHGTGVAQALPNPLPVVLISLAGSAIFLVTYYALLRPWLGETTARAMDGFRNRLGIGLRILYGGIVEEVITRWGLMSFLAWVAAFLLPETAAIWTAIVLSGVLFGLGHLPSYLAAGCERSPALVITQVVLNLFASLVFGYLFWQYGLLAAMISHALFHLAWYPIDIAVERRVALLHPAGD
jgi:hypothetical protein